MNKRTHQIILCIMLCTTLSLSLFGCSKPIIKGSEEFAEFTKTIPAIIFENENFQVNFLFDEPEKYGINKELYGLNYVTLEMFETNEKKSKNIISKLKEYNYEALTEDQRITYDLLETMDDNKMDTTSLYYLSYNYLDASKGIVATLPATLNNYSLKNKKALDSFVSILEDCPKMFEKYVAHEEERQEKGFGMPQFKVDDIISVAKNMSTEDQQYILNTTLEKVDALDFISGEEKNVYKSKIDTAFHTSFIEAYRLLVPQLESIKIEYKGDGSFADYPSGKEYYKKLVLSQSGFASMKEYREYLEEQKKKIEDLVVEINEEDPTIIERMRDPNVVDNIQYTDLTTNEEVLDFLEKKVNENNEFPKIKPLIYRMEKLHQKEGGLATLAAAYYLSPYDNLSGENELMIMNSDFKPSSFSTLAHEGFPGHMYQHNYFKSIPHDLIRNLMSSEGYTEGWATYIESEIIEMSLSPLEAKMKYWANIAGMIGMIQLEDEIQYDGLSKAELAEQTGMDVELISADYESIISAPATAMKYYVGCLRIMDLKDKAKEVWGEEYTDYRFHKAVLDLGPLPLDLLEKYMEKNW